MMKGEEIKQLIPQCNPMLMVDEFEIPAHCTGENGALTMTEAYTALTVRPDNMFIYANGELSESGLIEHMAQSASALAGYRAREEGATKPPIGIIGEVKHFECRRRPLNGDRVETAISFGFSFGNATVIHATSTIDGVVVAEAQMKIFL